MPTPEQQALLRQLPQIEELLHHEALAGLTTLYPRTVVADQSREVLDSLRSDILSSTLSSVNLNDIVTRVLKRFVALERPSLCHVVNASGVIVHTNLGRSVLAPSAIEAVNDVIKGYSTLEYSTQTMQRGSRHDHYEKLVCNITGAQAAIAVNNNAAAVMMVLREFCEGREAIISRGELVEIGGSFRVPDIMQLSGAHMVEVGTTNKTHIFDYQRALSQNTGLLVKVHPSNFRMTGFTEEVQLKELRELADTFRQQTGGTHSAPLVYEDLGSGALVDISACGIKETTVSECLQQGADLVSFSCDKLLGGPQAGIIVGNKELIDRLKKNPLARALRLDKMTIAALEATLRLYLDENDARALIPTLHMLSEPLADIDQQAQELCTYLKNSLNSSWVNVSVEDEISRAGGGALPMCDIPTKVVAIEFLQGSALKCDRFLNQNSTPPIIARLKNEHLLFDVRTLLGMVDFECISQALRNYFEQLNSSK